jgi:dTDP-4-dehydrorhamnose reductase
MIAAAFRQPDFSGWGIHHLVGAPSTSWYEFAEAIFARARLPVPHRVVIDSQDYPTQAARPCNSTLNCGRVRPVFNLDQPDWRISLSRVLISELAEAAKH